MLTVRLPNVFLHGFVLVAALAAIPTSVFAQSDAARAPDNASARKYGSGWSCDRGYREVSGACARVELPANAHLATNGHGWECERGYQAGVDRCIPIVLPSNEASNALTS